MTWQAAPWEELTLNGVPSNTSTVVVGAVVFLILLVVNFAVITKGSGRIAEVAQSASKTPLI